MKLEIYDMYPLDKHRVYWRRLATGQRQIRLPITFTRDLYITF